MGYGEGAVHLLREATSTKPGKYRFRQGRAGIDQEQQTVEFPTDTEAK
jgi:hypothetical protein